MTEHLDTNKFAFPSAYILLYYIAMDSRNLLHIEFARQDNHIGKLRIEAHRLRIGYIELGR